MALKIKLNAIGLTSVLLTVFALGATVIPAHAGEGGRAGEEPEKTAQPANPAPQRTAPSPTPAATPAPAPQQAQPRQAAPVPQQTQPRQAAPRAPAVIVETAPSGLPPVDETRFEPDELIVRFQTSSDNASRNRAIAGLGIAHQGVRTFVLPSVTVHLYRLPPNLSVREAITRLEASPAVVNAQPNYLYTTAQSESGAKLPQFGNDMVSLSDAHARTTGANTRIGIIDTAVDSSHAELANTTIASFDVTDGASNVDPHGTSVAGILAANAKLIGVAPDAQIVSIAAFSTDASGTTQGNTWTIMEALNVAVDQRVDVLNMSFAGPPDPLFERAMQGAQRENMIPVAAAGNDGPGAATRYPAGYDTVVSVTATDSQNAVYAKANTGGHIDFAAPGVDLLVLGNGSAFRTTSGTSMATAYISGIVALTLSANPGADIARLRSLLENSATDLGSPGKDSGYGDGLPSAAAAIGGLLN